MQCPKCRFETHDDATECPRCGIVFAKYARLVAEQHDKQTAPEPDTQTEDARQELTCRIFAVPAALLAARIAVTTIPFLVRLLSMMVHESGHAVTAWLCGYWAVPGLWFTPVSDNRNVGVTILLIAVFGVIGVWGYKTRRPHIVVAAILVFIFQLMCTRLPYLQAHTWIIFGGDAGMMVLGTILMLTFYARRGSPVYENGLRWGFLVIGANAFMDAFHQGTGNEDGIPFGEQEGMPTDPSQLVENLGWSIPMMIQHYVRLAEACLVVLAIVYIFQIIQIRRGKWESA